MATLKWVPYSGGDLPENMVHGGERFNGEELYVCRGVVNGIVTPGKFWAVGQLGYVPQDGVEVTLEECEILTCDKPDLLHWVPAANGEIVDGAITAGFVEDTANLYVGRGRQNDELIPGKIYPEFQCCYVSTDGKEWELSEYEVLVVKSLYSLIHE